jgi:hypothetical protein
MRATRPLAAAEQDRRRPGTRYCRLRLRVTALLGEAETD